MRRKLSAVLSFILICGLIFPSALMTANAGESGSKGASDTKNYAIEGIYSFEQKSTEGDFEKMLKDKNFQEELKTDIGRLEDKNAVKELSAEELLDLSMKKTLVALNENSAAEDEITVEAVKEMTFAEAGIDAAENLKAVKDAVGIEDILDELVEDMGPYLWWSDGRIGYSMKVCETYERDKNGKIDADKSRLTVTEFTIDFRVGNNAKKDAVEVRIKSSEQAAVKPGNKGPSDEVIEQEKPGTVEPKPEEPGSTEPDSGKPGEVDPKPEIPGEAETEPEIPGGEDSGNEITTDENGIHHDKNGNVVIPWDKIKDKTLTLDKLKEKCGDSLILIMDDDGEHVLFVGGHYTDIPVTDEDSAVKAILVMKDLIGLEDEKVLFLAHTEKDLNGNSYYQFIPNEDSCLNTELTIVLGADKDGDVISISAPPAAVWDKDAAVKITEGRAAVLMKVYAGSIGAEYAKGEMKLEYHEAGRCNCYTQVFPTEDGYYAKIYVPVDYPNKLVDVEYYSSPEDADNPEVGSYDFYFNTDNPVKEMSFTDSFGNEVTLPVAYEEGKGYYFIDKDRKMIGLKNEGDAVNFSLLEMSKPYYFDSPEDIETVFVTAFNNLTNIFDTYSKMGLYTEKTPILVDFLPDDSTMNAFADYKGNAIRIILTNCSLTITTDIVAHELTHAIVMQMATEIPYTDATGAINESYADIIGNIMEMIIYEEGLLPGAEVDTESWLIGETRGEAVRSMKNPNAFLQPDTIYGAHFVMPNPDGNIFEDYGGVHMNSGILNHIAYEMHEKADLSLTEILTVFYEVAPILNPNIDYAMMEAYVEYSMQLLGYDKDKTEQVKSIFAESGVNVYDKTLGWKNMPVAEGCYRLMLNITEQELLPENVSISFTDITTMEDGSQREYVCLADSEKMYGHIFDRPETIDNDLSIYVMDNEYQYICYGSVIGSIEVSEDTTLNFSSRDVITSLYAMFQGDYNPLMKKIVRTTDQMAKVFLDIQKEGTRYVYVCNFNEDNDNLPFYNVYLYDKELGGVNALLRTDTHYDVEVIDYEGNSINLIKGMNVEDYLKEGENNVIRLDGISQAEDASDLNSAGSAPEAQIEQTADEENAAADPGADAGADTITDSHTGESTEEAEAA